MFVLYTKQRINPRKKTHEIAHVWRKYIKNSSSETLQTMVTDVFKDLHSKVRIK